MLPDIDAVPGIITGDFRAFHNQWTHSIVVGLVVAAAVGAYARWKKASFGFWSSLTFFSYSLHVLMDGLTFGTRGVMLFWPLTSERFAGPVRLFMGVEWSEGLLHPVHLWMVASELLFALTVAVIAHWIEKRVVKAADH